MQRQELRELFEKNFEGIELYALLYEDIRCLMFRGWLQLLRLSLSSCYQSPGFVAEPNCFRLALSSWWCAGGFAQGP
jgi:hypothetical protein